MAEGKRSFLLYCDLVHTVKEMPDDKAGKLIKHILSYVNDEDPFTDDLVVKLVFEPIKQQLKRDLKKWEERSERSRENGKKGGRPKETDNQVDNKNPEEPTGTQQVFLKPRKPDTVNVTVNVSDTVNDKEEKEEIIVSPLASTEKQKSNYEVLTGIYFEWFEKDTGVKPMFNGKEGKAMKLIVAHFEKNAKEKGFDNDTGVKGAWSYILANWGRLKDYERGQKNISQIASNLNNILNQLRNGTPKDKHANKHANSDW